jgi:hypothetical protein
MPDIPSEIEVYAVQPVPLSQADADHLGLVGRIKHAVPTAMDVAAGPVVRGLV